MKRYLASLSLKLTTNYGSKIKFNNTRLNSIIESICDHYPDYKVVINSSSYDSKFCEINFSVELVTNKKKSELDNLLEFYTLVYSDYKYIFNINYIIPMKLTSINK